MEINYDCHKIGVTTYADTNFIDITIEYETKKVDMFEFIQNKSIFRINYDNLNKAINKLCNVSNALKLKLKLNLSIHNQITYNTVIDYFMSLNNLIEIDLTKEGIFHYIDNETCFIDDLVRLIDKNSIKTLLLSNSSIAFEKLFDKLVGNNSITDIDLSNNVLCDEAYVNLSKYLKSSNKISRLNVCNHLIYSHAVVSRLADSLMENSSLSYLNLGNYHNIDTIDDVIKILNEIASKNHMLQTIEYYQDFDDDLKSKLDKNHKLLQTKLFMMMIHKIKNCIVSTMPKRLLVYLLIFLDGNIE